jgi:hypothetical protein
MKDIHGRSPCEARSATSAEPSPGSQTNTITTATNPRTAPGSQPNLGAPLASREPGVGRAITQGRRWRVVTLAQGIRSSV